MASITITATSKDTAQDLQLGGFCNSCFIHNISADTIYYSIDNKSSFITLESGDAVDYGPEDTSIKNTNKKVFKVIYFYTGGVSSVCEVDYTLKSEE
ncbi:MAG: hypothetical protein AB1779_04855 [Candidatus Thermoplasmatota archaeon]